MRIIISPAKKMSFHDELPPLTVPRYLAEAKQILAYLRAMTPSERRQLWGCSDAIARENEDRLRYCDPEHQLTPAILAYDGIQYQYMAPSVFENSMLNWVQEHVRILSGLYGVLLPMDGITEYRLEMQAKAHVNGTKSLYDFWGGRLYQAVLPEDRTILNLASAEYSKAIAKHLTPDDRMITCVFGEQEKGKIVQKGVYAKMARGEMVRYLAEAGAEKPEDAQGFDRLNYTFQPDISSENEYVFLRRA